jgi:hypothetical protein
MKREVSVSADENGVRVSVTFSSPDGTPEMAVTVWGPDQPLSVVRRRLTHAEVNEIRSWTEIAYPRGQEPP